VWLFGWLPRWFVSVFRVSDDSRRCFGCRLSVIGFSVFWLLVVCCWLLVVLYCCCCCCCCCCCVAVLLLLLLPSSLFCCVCCCCGFVCFLVWCLFVWVVWSVVWFDVWLVVWLVCLCVGRRPCRVDGLCVLLCVKCACVVVSL